MNISQMVRALASGVPVPRGVSQSYARIVSRAVWERALGLIRAVLLKGYSVAFPAIGTLVPVVRQKSLRYNVNAGRMSIRPASRRVKFIMSTLLSHDLATGRRGDKRR